MFNVTLLFILISLIYTLLHITSAISNAIFQRGGLKRVAVANIIVAQSFQRGQGVCVCLCVCRCGGLWNAFIINGSRIQFPAHNPEHMHITSARWDSSSSVATAQKRLSNAAALKLLLLLTHSFFAYTFKYSWHTHLVLLLSVASGAVEQRTGRP